jgi:2-haloacid dehalogenase
MVPVTLSRPRALVFDVMGTVVDIAGGVRAVTTRVLTARDTPSELIDRVVGETDERLNAGMRAVSDGDRPWAGHRELRRAALRETVASLDLPALSAAEEDDLSGAVGRVDPWPDSPAGLARLRELLPVVALSNADPAELAALSVRGGLAWHLALSTRPSQAYKPDPRAYRVALEALELEAGEVLMVAAHAWDLRGAAELGYRTAYVQRPDQGPPDSDFDLVVDDLHALAGRIGAL